MEHHEQSTSSLMAQIGNKKSVFIHIYTMVRYRSFMIFYQHEEYTESRKDKTVEEDKKIMEL